MRVLLEYLALLYKPYNVKRCPNLVLQPDHAVRERGLRCTGFADGLDFAPPEANVRLILRVAFVKLYDLVVSTAINESKITTYVYSRDDAMATTLLSPFTPVRVDDSRKAQH